MAKQRTLDRDCTRLREFRKMESACFVERSLQKQELAKLKGQ